jgi:hypothetical protein
VTESTEREDRAILEALAALDAEAPETASRAGARAAAGPWGGSAEEAEAEETLRRLYLETLGLLAYAAEPAAPPPGARERLLAALEEGRGRPAEPPAAPRAAVVPFAPPEAPERPARSGVEEPIRRPAPRRRGRMGALAALAAVLLVAAAGVAGWLYLELDRARGALAQLEEERSRLAERLSRQEDLIHRGGQIDGVLAAVSTPGVEVCPLHPMGDPPVAPGAFAILYMPPGSGTWYLLGSNLRPAEGVYVVWLNTPRGDVPAGVLESGEQSILELDAAALGDLSGLTSITVTVEPSPDMPEPQGPMVLYGDEKMTVL